MQESNKNIEEHQKNLFDLAKELAILIDEIDKQKIAKKTNLKKTKRI